MENAEPLMDMDFSFNLPEMLAGDLERSSEVFISKRLTAGAPVPALADDGTKRRYSLQSSSATPIFSSRPRHILSENRTKSLQTMDKVYSRNLAMSTNEVQQSTKGEEEESDTTSVSDYSRGMEPPLSIPHRDESVGTAPTSVDSDRRTSPICPLIAIPPKSPFRHKAMRSSSSYKIAGASWMDFELERRNSSIVFSTTERKRSNSMADIGNYASVPISPKQQVFKSSDAGDLRSMSLNSRVDRAHLPISFRNPFDREGQYLREPEIPTTHTHEKPLTRPNLPQRRSSLRHRDFPPPPGLLLSSTTSRRSNPPSSTPYPPQVIPFSKIPGYSGMSSTTKVATTLASPLPTPPKLKYGDPKEDDMMSRLSSDSGLGDGDGDGDVDDGVKRSLSSANGYPEIASTSVNIEAWLASSNQPFSNELHHTPLPQGTVESLRVSVTNFPSTMLLCTSVPIETIRSRTRQLRRHINPTTPFLQANHTMQPKQSRLAWIPGFKKQTADSPSICPVDPNNKTINLAGQRRDLLPELNADNLGTTDRISAVPSWFEDKPDWAYIKNIFPGGTDYLCDALYAHLLAYNYVTSLCSRINLSSTVLDPSSVLRPTSKSSAIEPPDPYAEEHPRLVRSSTDGTQIPDKAAKFLGMHQVSSELDLRSPPQHGLQPSLTSGSGFRNAFLGTKRSYKNLNAANTNGGSSTTLTTARPRTSSGNNRPRTQEREDQKLRELRLGLATCVARLVNTLRTNSGLPTAASVAHCCDAAGAAQVVDVHNAGGVSGQPEQDALLMRALCEIVRCREEK